MVLPSSVVISNRVKTNLPSFHCRRYLDGADTVSHFGPLASFDDVDSVDHPVEILCEPCWLTTLDLCICDSLLAKAKANNDS